MKNKIYVLEFKNKDWTNWIGFYEGSKKDVLSNLEWNRRNAEIMKSGKEFRVKGQKW
jgi:hypothetical protein